MTTFSETDRAAANDSIGEGNEQGDLFSAQDSTRERSR
jgi:hypothetical protein